MDMLLKHFKVDVDFFYLPLKDTPVRLDLSDILEDQSVMRKWALEIMPDYSNMVESIIQYVTMLYSRRPYTSRQYMFSKNDLETISKYLLKIRVPTLPNQPNAYKDLTMDEVVERIKSIIKEHDECSTAPSCGHDVNEIYAAIFSGDQYYISSNVYGKLVIYVLVKMIVEKTFPHKLNLCKEFK